MKKQSVAAAVVAFSICLFTGAASHIRGAIVLDDPPSEPAPQTKKPGIDVPKPKDNAARDEEKSKAQPSSDTLRFLNKDTLHGTLLSVDQENGIRWKSPEAKEPIAFKNAGIAEVKLDSHKPPQAVAPGNHAVALTNDDELPGNIVTLDDHTLVLDTWYAGKLSIPRAMIRRITPLKASGGAVYEGPTGLDGWTVGRQGGGKSWTFRDGAFIGTNYGMIGRDVKLPNMANIEFDLTWRGNTQLSVIFYSDRTDNISNCYMLQINSGYSYLQRYARNGGSSQLGEVQMQNLMRREKTHLSLRANKETKTIWLLVDGKVAKQWTDPGDWAGAGTSLLFNCQPGSFVKISNIKVTNWNGQFEEVNAGDAKTTEDSVKLENNDKVSGKLKSIQDGKAVFESSYAPLTIPLDRVEEITLSSQGANQAKRNAGDVRAYFTNRGSVTMHLETWDEKQASASSANFGHATFSPDAFQRILFNLDQQAAATDDLATSSDNGDQPEE